MSLLGLLKTYSPDPDTLECRLPLSRDQAFFMKSSSHVEMGASEVDPSKNRIWWDTGLRPGTHPLDRHFLLLLGFTAEKTVSAVLFDPAG